MSNLTAVAIFKNEAPYLREWIEFHTLVGVDHFLLYDNNSEDDWLPEVAGANVTVVPWAPEPGQLLAYYDAIVNGLDSTWMAFLDIDEFLYSPTGLFVPEVLEDFQQYAGVAVNWRTFGTGDVLERPWAVVPTYLQHARREDPINHHVKSIVQPLHVHPQMHDPHHFQPLGDERIVNTDGLEVEGPFNSPPLWDVLVVNHYMSKSRDEAEAKARVRRSDNGQLRDLSFLTSDALNEERSHEAQGLYTALLMQRMNERRRQYA